MFGITGRDALVLFGVGVGIGATLATVEITANTIRRKMRVKKAEEEMLKHLDASQYGAQPAK